MKMNSRKVPTQSFQGNLHFLAGPFLINAFGGHRSYQVSIKPKQSEHRGQVNGMKILTIRAEHY